MSFVLYYILNLTLKTFKKLHYRVVLLINIPTDGLVMEEVNNRGYHVQFEKTGLNLVQSKLALQKLAYFHAASVILQTTSADFKKFSKGTFHTDFKDKLNFFEDAYKIAVDNATELGVSSSIKNKLKEMMPIALPKVIEDYTSSMKDFKVLNHGDFFTKNIFFKYNKNELVDVLFVSIFKKIPKNFHLKNDLFCTPPGGFPKLRDWLPNYRPLLLPDHICGLRNLLCGAR